MTASIIQENRPVTDIRKENIRNILMLLRQKNLCIAAGFMSACWPYGGWFIAQYSRVAKCRIGY